MFEIRARLERLMPGTRVSGVPADRVVKVVQIVADLLRQAIGLAEATRDLAYRHYMISSDKDGATGVDVTVARSSDGNVAAKARYEGRSLAEWVPFVAETISARFRPVKIVLFGSVARGDDGPDSDIDLLVVVDKLGGRRHDAAVAILRALRDIPAPVDVVVADPSLIERTGHLPGILRVALREGQVIRGRAA